MTCIRFKIKNLSFVAGFDRSEILTQNTDKSSRKKSLDCITQKPLSLGKVDEFPTKIERNYLNKRSLPHENIIFLECLKSEDVKIKLRP